MASQSSYTALPLDKGEEEEEDTPIGVKLIIRFASSLPDYSFPISEPHTTTIPALKQKIRTHLPPDQADAGIRLIAGGRVLEETKSIGEALRLPQIHQRHNDLPTSKQRTGKGKAKLTPPPLQTIYIHAALSTPLSPASLAAEADLALLPAESLLPPPAAHFAQPSSSSTITAAAAAAPLGFDRLTGFSTTDIASLRAQFRAQIAARHTPDTMPNDAALRALEERWLDGGNNNNNNTNNNNNSMIGSTTTGEVAGIGEEDDNAAALDDALWGAVTGFFWPLGALSWGLREEGVWSRRRQLGVLVGVATNLGFGVLKFLN